MWFQLPHMPAHASQGPANSRERGFFEQQVGQQVLHWFNNKRDYEKAFQSGGEGCPGPSAVEVRRKDVALEVTRHSSRSLQARPRPTKWYVKCSGRLVENTAFISLRLGTASCCAVMEPK